MEKKKSIMVFVEQNKGSLSRVTLELVCEAKKLASKIDGEVTAVCTGHGLTEELKKLGHYGCSRVYYTEDERLDHFTALPCARAVVETILRHDPDIVLFPATSMGRAVAPRIASQLRCGLTADCTGLDIGDYSSQGKSWERILLQIRPAFGGNVIATIVSPESRPSMATVRPGVMKLEEPDSTDSAAIVYEKVDFTERDFLTRIISIEDIVKEVDLVSANIIVSAGMGAASPASLKLVRELCTTLHGALGASRAMVDSGLLSKEHQVGQTGTTVRPNLYIACGISGQIQHRAGMAESKRIIAINSDPEAPIFKIAHYGIVGDLNRVIPMMLKAYREKS